MISIAPSSMQSIKVLEQDCQLVIGTNMLTWDLARIPLSSATDKEGRQYRYFGSHVSLSNPKQGAVPPEGQLETSILFGVFVYIFEDQVLESVSIFSRCISSCIRNLKTLDGMAT